METNIDKHSLSQATIIAFTVAVVALVLFIMPAEYNIDPTGLGEKMGLTVFNEEPEAQPLGQVSDGSEADSIILTVPAGQGIEYKLNMSEFKKVTYEWTTDEGELFFDLHGEPQGDTTGYFESYAIATSNKMKGSFTAPFAGSHGWYWKNESANDIQVQLIFKGEYTIEGLK